MPKNSKVPLNFKTGLQKLKKNKYFPQSLVYAEQDITPNQLRQKFQRSKSDFSLILTKYNTPAPFRSSNPAHYISDSHINTFS